eukprot:1100387-Prymnesium_polylepis.1
MVSSKSGLPLDSGFLPDSATCPIGDHQTHTVGYGGGLRPMMRPGAVTDATRALRCLWHEIGIPT